MRRASDDERRARLARRHRLAGGVKAATPEEAAGAVVALHGTDPASVFLSTLARMDGGAVSDVERALYEDRTLLRVLAMRRTMFVAPLDTAGVLLAACSRAVAARERKRLVGLLEAAGVADDVERWLSAAERAAVASLAARGEAAAPEIAGDDPKLGTQLVLSPGKRYEARQTVASRVLTVLGAQGRAVRTRPRGGWTSTQFRWASLSTWQPSVPAYEPEPARAELARRYLAAFGPATVEDLRWWTGWTLGQTRAALAGVNTADVMLDGGEGALVLAEDAEPVTRGDPSAALLPALDATTMGWKARGWYLAGHGPQLFDVNGNAGPTVWWDARVVGGWAQSPHGEIRIRLLEDVGADAAAAVEQAAAATATRIGAAKLSPRARARCPAEAALLA